MKRFLVFATTVILFVTACSTNHIDLEGNNDVINYQAFTGKTVSSTKVDGLVYPTDLPFVSYAYFYRGTQNWNEIKDGLDVEESSYIPGDVVKYDSVGNNYYVAGYWHTDKVYFWPVSQKLTFFAYSPATVENVSCSPQTGIVAKDYDVDQNLDIDFMVADVKADLQKSYNSVPTVFRHKLCQIYFTVASYNGNVLYDYAHGHNGVDKPFAAGDVRWILKKLELLNVYNKATYVGTSDPNETYGSGNWNMVGSARNYTLFDGNLVVLDSVQRITASNPNKYFMPQNLKDVQVRITYMVEHYADNEHTPYHYTDSTRVFNLSQVRRVTENPDTVVFISNWDMNTIYSYNLHIDFADNEIKWAPSIISWEDTDKIFESDTIIH
ncbi:MAG: fimbrillin family protein [Bacteroidaceae bacterium]|nr:fimbrillin family protein [Bacteroidaceae bacterium]